MALMYRESGFALKIMLEVVALQIQKFHPLKLSLISPTILKHFLSVLHYLNQDGAEVHILSGAPPVEFVSYSLYVFLIYVFRLSSPSLSGGDFPAVRLKSQAFDQILKHEEHLKQKSTPSFFIIKPIE